MVPARGFAGDIKDLRAELAELSAGLLHEHGPNEKVIEHALRWRVVELGEDACVLFERGRVLASALCARACLESAALLHAITTRLPSDPESAEISDWVVRHTFGGREQNVQPSDAGERLVVQNVLSHLNKIPPVDGETVRESVYDTLCEYAHPNYLGVMGYFATPREDDFALGSKSDEFLESLVYKALLVSCRICSLKSLDYSSNLAK